MPGAYPDLFYPDQAYPDQGLNVAYSDEVLADSPLLYWKLNEASGTSIADSSGNTRTGTATASGITYSETGQISGDSALTFDGSSGGIALTTAIDMNAYTAYTVEFWMKVAAFNNTDDMACELTATGSNAAGGMSIDPCDSTGKFGARLKCPAGTNSKLWTRPSTDVFHHYVFVFKKNTQAGAITGYLDGSLWTPDTNVETGTSQVNAANDKFYFASRAATSLFLACTLDEVAIYGADIGSTRVAAHFNAASGASDLLIRGGALVGGNIIPARAAVAAGGVVAQGNQLAAAALLTAGGAIVGGNTLIEPGLIVTGQFDPPTPRPGMFDRPTPA